MGLPILENLKNLGVTVTVIGPDRLRLQPASVIPAKLMEQVRQAKPEILKALTQRPETCAASCYETEPGKWVHHPWDGCRTMKPKAPTLRQVEAKCWHCSGAGRCACITCAEGLWAGEAGECRICHGFGKAMAWIQ